MKSFARLAPAALPVDAVGVSRDRPLDDGLL